MPKFHHHPDNLIYVRPDGAGQTYMATVETFSDDLAYLGLTAYEGLPSGMNERQYDGSRHFLFDGVSQHAGEEPWPAGNEYLGALDDLLARQASRS